MNTAWDPRLNPGTGMGVGVGWQESIKDVIRTIGRIGMQTVYLMYYSLVKLPDLGKGA